MNRSCILGGAEEVLLRFVSGTNWLLIFSLVFGSAALSVFGDSLGSKYGKKRVTLFGLRPRRTSQLITAITGALIAVGILAVMSAISQDVRTALFGMKLLKQQMYDLQFQLTRSEENAQQARIDLAEASASLDLTGFELDTMKNDQLILEQQKQELEATLTLLREESEQLRHDLKTMKSEAIAVNANALLGQAAFEPGMNEHEIIAGLIELRRQIRLNILERISNQSFTQLRDVPIDYVPEEAEALIHKLMSADMRQYVRASSGENYTVGEDAGIMIRIESGTSILVYPKGTPVYRKFFMNDRVSRRGSAEEMLHVFLRELRTKAVNDGILPEPATGNVGTLEGEEFFDAVDSLEGIHGPVIITALAARDIYTEGPVAISIIFEE